MEPSAKRRRTDAYAEAPKHLADTEAAADIDPPAEIETRPAPQLSKPKTTELANLKELGDAYQYKSNILKMEVDEMLSEVSLDQQKRMAAVEKTLHHLRMVIESIPEQRDLTISSAEKEMKARKVHIPFPDPAPTSDVQYKFSYSKPSFMNVVGSFAMKTMTKQKDVLSIDLVVTIPEDILQEKDYLNYRYFHKRAFYLAALAGGIRHKSVSNINMCYEFMDDDNLRPILVLSPSEDGSIMDFRSSKCLIRIMPSAPPGLFIGSRLLPWKSSLRSLQHLYVKLETRNTSYGATPYYNSSVAVDGTYIPYLRHLHASAKSAQAFTKSCILGRIWLRQRGFGGSISKGGFGNAEWAVLTAFLLKTGGPKGRPLLSAGYSDFQMFKAVLQFLAARDLKNDPVVLNASEEIRLRSADIPTVYDGEHGLNILFKMTDWSYDMVRHEASVTLECLNNTVSDMFESVFLLMVDNPIYRFDAVVSLPMPMDTEVEIKPTLDDSHPRIQYLKRLYQALKVGLGDRVTMVHLAHQYRLALSISGTNRDQFARIRVGLLFNESNIDRTTDHGPPVDDKKAAASFRKFWGEIAELRRYPDGSISESVSWQHKGLKPRIYQQIVRHVLGRHLGAGATDGPMFCDSELVSLIQKPNVRSPLFQTIQSHYESLEADLRSLIGLPLALRHVSGSGAVLRSASIHIPSDADQSSTEPVDIIVQFESSGRWPDDLPAIQKTKISFLVRMGELLEVAKGDQVKTRVGLENEGDSYRNGAFLLVSYNPGTTFRIRIHHDREAFLLEKIMLNPSSGPRDKDRARAALLNYRQNFILLPRHTQIIRKLCHRFPSVSPTMRVMKKWFYTHMLSPHVSEELIELFVARVFVQPYPWNAPGSTLTGFVRTLHLLSNWDWTAEPLVVDLDYNSITSSGFRQVHEAFQNIRKKDPAINSFPMFIATNYGLADSVWSEENPTKVVAARITALARLAVGSLGSEPSDTNLHKLFTPSIEDYDAILHMNTKRLSAGAQRRTPKFKNLAIDSMMPNPEGLMLDPVQDFVTQISEIYDGIAVFFWDSLIMNRVGVVWSPQTRPRNWKPSITHSTIPMKSDKETMALFNKDATLHEIARLGGDLISKIEVRST